MKDPAFWIAFIAACMGCYFGACTIALRTFSRPRLAELLEELGRGDRLEPFVDSRAKMQLATATIRTFMSLVVLLSVLYLFEHHTAWALIWQYVAALVVTGLVVSIFIVAIPGSWARYQPEKLLAWSMPVLGVARGLMLPVVAFLHAFDPIVRRLSGVDVDAAESDEMEALTDEVMSVVEGHDGNDKVDDTQKDMIEAVFELPSMTADEIMTPRTDIEGLETVATLDQIKSYVQEQGHSRIPIYEENLDQILGILYVKDLIKYLDSPDATELDLKQVMREAMLVPETKSVNELLAEFKAKKVHIAIVLDEYGGTAGLVTIEDILEELVGEIQDEYEPHEDEATITHVSEDTVEVDGRVHVDVLNSHLDVDLPEDDDYDTVAGFVVAKLGHIPDVGEILELENLKLTVTRADRTKVTAVQIQKQPS